MRSGSSRSMETNSGRIANGRKPYVMPRITEMSVFIRMIGSLVSPTAWRMLVTTPVSRRMGDVAPPPLVPQRDDPGGARDQVARQERQHHQDDQEALGAPAVPADPVR